MEKKEGTWKSPRNITLENLECDEKDAGGGGFIAEGRMRAETLRGEPKSAIMQKGEKGDGIVSLV